MHTAPYFAALGFLTIVHALRGNQLEYAPIGLVLLAALEFVQAPVWYLHLTGVTLLIGLMLKIYRPSVSMKVTMASIGLGSLGVLVFTFLGGPA